MAISATPVASDGHRWHLMVGVPKYAIVGRFDDGTTKRVRATWRGWVDDRTGLLLAASPVRWRYMIEEVDI